MAKKIKDKNGNVYVQKKPFYKKWWFILLVAIILIGTFAGGGSDEKVTKESSAELEQTSSSKEVTKESSAVTYKIGDVVKVGDVEYTVNSKSTADNVGGEFGKTANGVYLILNVTIKNNGDKALTVSDDFFKIFKGKTEYSSDSGAGIYANEDAEFFFSEINPENSLTGNVVFDLTPETANDSSLQLQVQTGVWGTETGLINLQ